MRLCGKTEREILYNNEFTFSKGSRATSIKKSEMKRICLIHNQDFTYALNMCVTSECITEECDSRAVLHDMQRLLNSLLNVLNVLKSSHTLSHTLLSTK